MSKLRYISLAAVILAGTIAFACEVDYPIWIPRSKTADPLYRFVTDGKAGYIDRDGRVVVPPTLDSYGNYGSEFHDGLLEISGSDGRYIDTTGKLVINKGLFRGWDFSEGLAAALKTEKGLWGYIDTSGKFAISPQFSKYPNGRVSSFSDGLAMIVVKGKSGYISHSGNFAIPPQFLAANNFSNGMAMVVAEGPCIYFPEGACASPQFLGGENGNSDRSCKLTFIDKAGRVITRQRFDYARSFSEGLAPVKIERLWGFIDKQGVLKIPPKFEDAEPFSSGLSRIRSNGLYGYADKSGAIKIAAQFRYADDFEEGLAPVGDDERYWYIDTNGDHAFAAGFAIASPFFKGLAHVKLLSGKEAYIDTNGHSVFTF